MKLFFNAFERNAWKAGGNIYRNELLQQFSDNVQFILNPIDLSFGSYRYLEN